MYYREIFEAKIRILSKIIKFSPNNELNITSVLGKIHLVRRCSDFR